MKNKYLKHIIERKVHFFSLIILFSIGVVVMLFNLKGAINGSILEIIVVTLAALFSLVSIFAAINDYVLGITEVLEKNQSYYIKIFKEEYERNNGTWRNLAAHLTWVQGVAGSNPAVPIKKED